MMAYCRWSSDNFVCDLYCYEDVSGGYTTHVAGSRYVGIPPDVDFAASEPLLRAQYKARSAWFDAAELRPIGGPYDGKTFNDPSLAAFQERILALGAAGYRYPTHLIADIDAEIAEEAGR